MKRWRISWELKSLILELENTVTENIDLINEFNRLGTIDEISEPAKILGLKLRKKRDENCRKHGQGKKESQKDGRERMGKKNIWVKHLVPFSIIILKNSYSCIWFFVVFTVPVLLLLVFTSCSPFLTFVTSSCLCHF